ncbi:MAG: cobyrinate a,c-diamide synthase [Chloroflexota bacterium]
MSFSISRLILAAPESGSGKTTVTSGLIAALRKRGRVVQPFKVGPDYIDPSYHGVAAGRPCRNLDAWMLGRDWIKNSFISNSREADIAIVEGVMGLFDGANSTSNEGSTADVAQILDAPIVLIVNARGMARSVAALVHGYHTFDPNIRLSGVILNRMGSARHAELCREAIEQTTDVPFLGYLPRSEALILPERHLGLVPTAEKGAWMSVIDKAATQIEETVDLGRLEAIASAALPLELTRGSNPYPATAPLQKKVRVGFADDEAFSFIYPENVELLEAAGAEIVRFSPLNDATLPENLDGLILSGGFPELYAARLSQNRSMLSALRQAAEAGMPIYAECGGLMILTGGIKDLDDTLHPMAGVLEGYCQMESKVTLGYRMLQALEDGPLLAAGGETRAHEFHYSSWQGKPDQIKPAYLIQPRRDGESHRLAGAIYKKVWASYMHVHFGSNAELPQRFVNFCGRYSRN